MSEPVCMQCEELKQQVQRLEQEQLRLIDRLEELMRSLMARARDEGK